MQHWQLIVICGAALLVGAVVQSLIGLGLALVASPVVAMLDPSLVPGTLIICSFVLPVLTLVHEHHDIDWRGLRWAFPARFIGTAIGAWLVAVASHALLGVVVGVFVLVAVALSLISWRPSPTPLALSLGALVSGIGGTATSIGGPPMALVYQHQRASMLRCTLAVYFIVGSLVSLATLTAIGELTWHQIGTALVLVPFVLLGFGAAVRLRRRVDVSKVRTGVLVVASVSAVILIVRSLLQG